VISGIGERRALQIAVAVGSLVPICAGAAGMWHGPAMVGIGEESAWADSHFAYLSGLLFGIGLGFVSTVPNIEQHTGRFRLLAVIVAIGGLGRLLSLAMHVHPTGATLFALAMELIVTPALALWQGRVARQASA
jgi:uncharacterized membrane protein YfcA